MGYKIKTHSGAAKRFKKSGSSIKSRGANRNHILTKQSTKRKRQNPQTNHGWKCQNDGYWIQTSLSVDGNRKRKGKIAHVQTKRYHEKNC